MKFGRNLTRNQVPQWASEYINYKALKKLIKSASQAAENGEEADLTEFFFTLDRNLETVDAFYNKKYSELSRRLKRLYARYGRSASVPDQSEKEELADAVNALLELRSQLRLLSWYGDINRRGFVKITKKLDKKVPSACAQHRYLSSRVDPRPFASSQRISQDLNSINTWLSTYGEIQSEKSDSGSGRSSFSMSRPLQNSIASFPEELISRLDQAIQEKSRDELAKAADEMQALPEVQPDSIQQLLLHFLNRAIFCRSNDCILELLKRIEILDENNDFNRRNILHKLLITIGRERSSKTNNRRTQPSPDLRPADTIAPAAAPGPEFTSYGLDEIESSRLLTGNDDTAALITFVLDNLTETQRPALTGCDTFGRMPIHYAAMYGFVDVCKSIFERMLQWHLVNVSNGIRSIEWIDTDGNTPIHLSVLGGWRLTTETLLEVCERMISSPETGRPLKDWPSGSFLLTLATKSNYVHIVGLLARAGVDVNFQDEQGETVFHIAARFGNIECMKMLLKDSTTPVKIDIPEYTYGWTPLLTACVDGQIGIVELLINAGADLERLDSSGWTAKEHAALRGHMPIAELLSKHTKKLIPKSPHLKATLSDTTPKSSSLGDRGSNGINKENGYGHSRASASIKSFGHRYLQDESMVLVSLGSMDARKDFKPIALDNIPIDKAHATQLDTTLSVVVSALGATGEPSTIDLPVQENISTEPIAFMTKDPTKVRILFDIVPTYAGSEDQRVGRGVAILSSVRQNIGSKRMNLQGDISVPIVSAKTLDYIGTVNFNFTIITPFSHPNMSISEAHTYWKSLTSPMVIGHRGLGKNLASRKSLQLGENTMQSFIAAANLGAKYVEFDVQLTKDHVPVIYHDFLVSETGIDAPVHALTLDQFLHVNDPTPRASRPTTPPLRDDVQNNTSNGWNPVKEKLRRVQRANSVGGENDARSADMSERMKHTRDFKMKGFKGNSRGNFIQERFTTLEEMLRKLPESTGFNIEMKYPMLFESEEQEMDTYAVELNSFVDTVLKMVYDLGGNRNIIFSSFHPDICLQLSLKQPSIPVFFLTDAGMGQVSDIRASSLQEAIRFASRWNLLGVVTAAEPLVMCPRLVRVVKESGLVCVSYGTLNNDPDNVKLQTNEGIDAVIVDSVVSVRKGLTSEEAAKTVETGRAPGVDDIVSNGAKLTTALNALGDATVA